MNNNADKTSELPSFPVEPVAEGFANLGLALASPSFCPENLERLGSSEQEALGEAMPVTLWFTVISFALGRGPTLEELAALEFPEPPDKFDEFDVQESFMRALEEKPTPQSSMRRRRNRRGYRTGHGS